MPRGVVSPAERVARAVAEHTDDAGSGGVALPDDAVDLNELTVLLAGEGNLGLDEVDRGVDEALQRGLIRETSEGFLPVE